MPKVSIVLPSYNGEKYIRESIESVIGQAFEDWELIVVDDCSNDDTLVIAREYAAKDNRIRVIHNEVNQKLPRSLNIGFKSACGDYLTWTSDDNYYLPCALEKMVDFLDNQPGYPMVCSKMDMIDENGKYYMTYEGYNEETMYFNNCVGASFLYRRCVLETIGEYNPDKFLVEDYEYWYRVLEHYGTIGFIPQVLYKYRTHSASLTGTREQEIHARLLQLRMDKINVILSHLRGKTNFLTRIYYDFLRADYDIKMLNDLFGNMIVAARMDGNWDDSKPAMVYGAGICGKKAFDLLKGEVSYFVDRDIKKIGNFYMGREIISIDEMLEKSEFYNICVAVGVEKLDEALNQLLTDGLRKCCTVFWVEKR